MGLAGLARHPVNGYMGFDPGADGADAAVTAGMVRALWRVGVTGTCVTLCTESEDHLLANCGRWPPPASRSRVAASVIGIHVEGRTSARGRTAGAHPLRHVRPPDIAEYRRLASSGDGRIRIITLSPEYPESVAYIRAIVDDGVVASIGHTAADGDQIRAAVDAGATWSTHLGNGAHALLPRHPNYIWHQLAEDRLGAASSSTGTICRPR